MENSQGLMILAEFRLGIWGKHCVSVWNLGVDTSFMPVAELFWSDEGRALKEKLTFFKEENVPSSSVFMLQDSWALSKLLISGANKKHHRHILSGGSEPDRYYVPGAQPSQDWHFAVGICSVHVGCWEVPFASTPQMPLASLTCENLRCFQTLLSTSYGGGGKIAPGKNRQLMFISTSFLTISWKARCISVHFTDENTEAYRGYTLPIT